MTDDKTINLRTDPVNGKCQKCKEKCKQSAKVTIVTCPNYKPKGV